MQRQVAIGAVVGFALTVIVLSVCDVRMSAPATPSADASVAQAPPPPPAGPTVEALPDVPKKPVERLTPDMRPGMHLRKSILMRRLAADGGH